MAIDQEDWKEKYKQLAQDMDALQSQVSDRSLELLTSRMAIALEGQMPAMDCALGRLRGVLKDGLRGRAFESAVTQVDQAIRSLDQTQEHTRTALLEVLHQWIRQLRQQLTVADSQAQLAQLSAAAEQAAVRGEQLPDLVKNLLALQAPLFTASSSSEQDFSLHPARNSHLSAMDEELLLQKISAELLALMSGLYIPQADVATARTLIRQIEQGITLQTLPATIQSIVKLVAAAASHSSADFENYLLNLTGQLAEVQSFLEESYQDEIAGGNETEQLSALIRQDVKAIHRVVTDSIDLAVLKKAVSTQLVSIVKSVDDYKRQEEVRDRALKERYAKMNSRLELMEEETQQVKAHMEAERLKALTDPLTSLPNRAAYDGQIAAELERWKRYKHHFSIAIGDLDFFKKINDSYGHLAGDKVLRLIGSILKKKCRTTDFVARYGGEEFILIMPATSAENALQAVNKIRLAIEKSPFNFHGNPVGITMSFGVAEIQADESAEALFERADKALYAAKHGGRNRVELG